MKRAWRAWLGALFVAGVQALRPLVVIPSEGCRSLSGTVVSEVAHGVRFEIRTIDDRQVALQVLRTVWARAHMNGHCSRERRAGRAVDSVKRNWDARSRLSWVGGVLVVWRDRQGAWLLDRMLYAETDVCHPLTLREAHWVIRSLASKTGCFASAFSDPETKYLLKLEAAMDDE